MRKFLSEKGFGSDGVIDMTVGLSQIAENARSICRKMIVPRIASCFHFHSDYLLHTSASK